MQELDQKIEQTIADERQHEMQFEAQSEVVEEQPLTSETVVGAIEQGMQNAAVAIDDPEPIQVASISDMVTGLAKATMEAQKRAGQAVPDEPVQTIAGRVVLKEATPEDVDAINAALGGEYTKGLNFPRLAEEAGDFDLATYYAQLKDVNAELFEKARRGTITFDTLLESAEERGIDNIVVSMLKRRPGTPATAEELLGGIIGSYHLIKETDAAFMAARALPAGADRQQAMTRANQMLAAQGTLLANVSGAASEAGRTMFVAREAGKRMNLGDLSERAERIKFLFSAESADDVEHIGELYMALGDPRAKAKFVEQGFLAKSMDVVTEVWINAILSNPVTHAVNVAGNASFMMLRTVETALASGIGRLRTLRPGSNPDRVRARETLAQLEGMRRGLADATLLMGRVMLTEMPGDMASKIDVRNTRAIGTTGDLSDIAAQIRNGNMAAGMVNMYGVAMRMPGRFLMAEDEFFKAIAVRMTVHQEAIIASGNLYDEAIAAGKTKAQAKALAAAEEARIIDNPPLDIMRTAKEAAKQMTFQGDLDGFMGQMQGVASHPIAKLFVPFFKTPTNVIKESLSRTPLAFLSPSIMNKIRAGGREADIALSKIATGSGIMGGFAYSAMGLDNEDNNVLITGAGPKDYKARQAMQRQGIQPYSINVKIYNEDGTWTQQYKSITFSRFDPVSGLLAMAADFAYYSQYEEDQAILDQLAMSLSSSAANYVTQMPFLQGVQEISALFRQPDKITEAGFEMFAQKLTEAGLALAPSVSSISAGIERVQDPTVRSTMLPEEGLFGEDVTELPTFARGFYTALQKAKARNPFFSDTVEPKLNLWGEVMTVGTGSGWDMINPVRIVNTKYNAVDEELMNLGQGIPMPQKKIDGVLLNAVQYNKILTYMNTMDVYGKMPGDDGYDEDTVLLATLQNELYEDRYTRLPTKEDKRDYLSSVVGKYKSAAIKILRAEDLDLDIKIDAVQ